MIIYNDSLAHVPDVFSLLSYQAKWHVDKVFSGPFDKDFLVCLTFSSRSEITRSLNKYHQYWRPMNLCCRFWRESQWMNVFILSQSSLMSLFTVLHSFNFSSNDFRNDGSSDPHLSVFFCDTSFLCAIYRVFHIKGPKVIAYCSNNEGLRDFQSLLGAHHMWSIC